MIDLTLKYNYITLETDMTNIVSIDYDITVT